MAMNGPAAPRPLGRSRPALEPLLAGALLVAALGAVATGPAPIPLRTVIDILLAQVGVPVTPTWTDAATSIVVHLRLTRVVLALTVAARAALGSRRPRCCPAPGHSPRRPRCPAWPGAAARLRSRTCCWRVWRSARF